LRFAQLVLRIAHSIFYHQIFAPALCRAALTHAKEIVAVRCLFPENKLEL